LLRAKREGYLESVRTAMQALRRDAGFFVDERLYEQVLKEAGE
jgi:predicted nucleic acid-binding protein